MSLSDNGARGDMAVVYKGDRPYIFVSYAHADNECVLPIVEALDEAGYRIWFDEGIEWASEWPDNIAMHINSCSRFLAFVSHAAVRSAYCRREILYALNHDKEMLVAYIDDVNLDQIKPGLELLLGEMQAKHRRAFETDEEFVESVLGAEVLEPCLRDDFQKRRKARERAIGMAHLALSSDGENVDELREALMALQALPAKDQNKTVGSYIERIEGRLLWLEAEIKRRERREAEEAVRAEEARWAETKRKSVEEAGRNVTRATVVARRGLLFKGLLITVIVCAVLVLGLFLSNSLGKESRFDSLLQQAATASTEATDNDGPSEAEQLYTDAIEIEPADLRPYDALVNEVYKADSSFTTSEASRWQSLFDANRASIEGLPNYDKLCFDAGIDYFFYYEYGDALVRGSQAVKWFERAKYAYDLAPAGSHNAEGSMTEKDRDSAEVYITISEFQQRISHAVAEGKESQTYTSYFDALESAVVGAADSEVIVQLRLYDVVMSVFSSDTYIGGLFRASISESRVCSLLELVKSQTDALADAAQASEVTQEIYNNIIDHYQSAVTNVDAVYNSAGARGQSN